MDVEAAISRCVQAAEDSARASRSAATSATRAANSVLEARQLVTDLSVKLDAHVEECTKHRREIWRARPGGMNATPDGIDFEEETHPGSEFVRVHVSRIHRHDAELAAATQRLAELEARERAADFQEKLAAAREEGAAQVVKKWKRRAIVAASLFGALGGVEAVKFFLQALHSHV